MSVIQRSCTFSESVVLLFGRELAGVAGRHIGVRISTRLPLAVLMSLVVACWGEGTASDTSSSVSVTPTTPPEVSTTPAREPSTTVSTPDLVTVPDVRSLPLGAAVEAMTEAGLVGVPSDSDSRDEEAVVRAQEPPAGGEVQPGSVVGFRTLTFGKRTCDTQVFPAGEGGSADVVTLGPLTLYGLEPQMEVDASAFEPDSNGLREAIKVGVRITGSSDSVLLALPSGKPGIGASLLYDLSTFQSQSGPYSISDGHQAVEFEVCDNDRGFYNGGFLIDAPGCIDAWVYENTFVNEPIMAQIGFGTRCPAPSP